MTARRVLLASSVAMVGLALACLWFAWRNVEVNLVLDDRDPAARATVERVGQLGRRTARSYEVRFTTDDGRDVRARIPLAERAGPLDEVWVRYDPRDPERFARDAAFGDLWAEPALFGTIAVVAAALAAVQLVFRRLLGQVPRSGTLDG